MAQPTKIVKGGFRATLALILSLGALAVSLFTYATSSREEGLEARLQELQSAMETLRAESADQLDTIRRQTAEALDSLSDTIRRDEAAEKPPGPGTSGG